jgi:FHS family glucose/mannose:H+ symporter-like MFS transporter
MSSIGGARSSKELPRLALPLLYLGAVFSGSLTVLLGCVLPRLSALEHLRDKQAGALLMVQFAFSASGALLVRRNFHETLARGYALISLGAVAMHVLPRQLAIAAIATYGLGLGLVMTSNSMLTGRIFRERRGVALSFLNLCWSVGATLSPLLIARVLDRVSMGLISTTVAVLSALFVGVPFWGRFRQVVEDDGRINTPLGSATPAIAYFGLLAFLYVGIESATGNWMSTYVSRVVAWDYTKSNLATACFWAALLLGRTAAPFILLWFAEVKLYLISVLCAASGVWLLVAAHTAWLVLLAAAIAGLGLAPIFPLTVSLFMAKAGQPKGTGWVFAVSGFGGAILPWLTGILSSSARSLRIGLLVPAGAALLLLLLACRLNFAAEEDTEALPQKAAHGPA